MPGISIVTGAHLCRNPRVVKEATALVGAGYEVTVLHQVHDDALDAEDRELAEGGGFMRRAAVDTRPSAGQWGPLRHRLLRRAGVEAASRLGWKLPDALGYGVRATLASAQRQKADLVIGHQEIGLWVVSRLLQEGRRVGFDMEDWHARDQLMEGARRPFALLERVEGDVLRGGLHVTTTSHVLAQALARAYDAPSPTVIYNAFPWSDRSSIDGELRDRADRERPSLHWVSQTIGPGRGLEELFQALHAVRTPVDVHLRGSALADAKRWLQDLFPEAQGHRLFVHRLVSPGELLSRIAEHDVGLALEWRDEPSRDLTVTNKILHYLLAGLAVVATDTRGQVEVARQAPGAVQLCRTGEIDDLARALNEAVENADKLRQAKQEALEAARTHFCWERNAPLLVDSVATALRGERFSGTPS